MSLLLAMDQPKGMERLSGGDLRVSLGQSTSTSGNLYYALFCYLSLVHRLLGIGRCQAETFFL